MLIPKRDRVLLLAIGLCLVCFSVLFQTSRKSNRFINQELANTYSVNNDFDTSETTGVFHDQQVASVKLPPEEKSQVLGVTDQVKKIYVNLSEQRLYAFEGNEKVYDFLISSGKWGRTPTGTFKIWSKFRYAKMSGGNPALHTYYYLPNVPYVMFFSNDQVPGSRGFSLHGTYWHSNFGHPMSHGCINMKTEEAALIYSWSQPTTEGNKPARASDENPGTEIVIFGEAPKE